ncbi:MAG: type IV pilus twitching motility protein PilT [Candidatus Firestonebacteria bacterium]
MNINLLLQEMLDQQASDIHLKVGSPPLWRIDGELVNFGDEKLVSQDTLSIANSLMNEKQKNKFERTNEIDLAKEVGDYRVRANISMQRGTIAIALRVIPKKILTFEELHLPEVLREISIDKRGLILVTGTAGSGKSTTLAAMINHINENLASHIVIIEDPIEFIFDDKKGCICQREVGVDTETFSTALKSVLRQDPDVIMVGEMRDHETISAALSAAETGHLVMSSLHTMDAGQTVDRIIDSFPVEQQSQIRIQLASTITAVISLRLLRRTGGKGRVPAIEILIATPTVRALIREQKTSQLRATIQAGAVQYKMQTFDQSLLELYKEELITMEDALAEANSPTELKLGLEGLISSGSSIKLKR